MGLAADGCCGAWTRIFCALGQDEGSESGRKDESDSVELHIEFVMPKEGMDGQLFRIVPRQEPEMSRSKEHPTWSKGTLSLHGELVAGHNPSNYFKRSFMQVPYGGLVYTHMSRVLVSSPSRQRRVWRRGGLEANGLAISIGC